MQAVTVLSYGDLLVLCSFYLIQYWMQMLLNFKITPEFPP